MEGERGQGEGQRKPSNKPRKARREEAGEAAKGEMEEGGIRKPGRKAGRERGHGGSRKKSEREDRRP